MRRVLCAVGVAAVLAMSLYPAPAAAAPSPLPPGAVKHPGEHCATVVQPPDGDGCPGPPNDVLPDGRRWCSGSAYSLGECYAAEQGFFSSVHLVGRNGTERCIIRRENGGGYGRSPNAGHFGRYQFSPPLWAHYGGVGPWGYASPGEQDYIFVRAVKAGGIGNWTQWDGC